MAFCATSVHAQLSVVAIKLEREWCCLLNGIMQAWIKPSPMCLSAVLYGVVDKQ